VASFYVQNFGCRATQADGAAIERQLLGYGWERASAPGDAKYVVLNTCTVTAEADKDVRASIRRIHRQNPACEILVTGCYAQRAPEELACLPGVSRVVGNTHKHQVAQMLAQDRQNCGGEMAGFVPLSSLGDGSHAAEVVVSDIFAHTELLAAPVFDGAGYDKTRPILKVQDGCDNRCSFCVIPFVRGQSRSLPVAEVLREMQALVAVGYKEVVISGINLGRWGTDFTPPDRFENLVRSILEDTGVERLRLSSIEPMDWSDELIAMVASSPRIARHAHVPLQTGSDRILRLMHRKYRPWHYAERIRKMRAAMPGAAIGADLMVGFPGETADDFEENRAFIADLPFTYLHVFTYSPRPGTPAAHLAGQVPVEVKGERNRILRELAAEKKAAFMRSLVGRTLSTITLSVHENGCTETLTDNYQKLWVEGRHQPNQILAAQVRNYHEQALLGTFLEDDCISTTGPTQTVISAVL
jgi:threonylcarbamoyladenosine tRNA methylthiotransferase MtaB